MASLESWSTVSFPSSPLCERIQRNVIFLFDPCGSISMVTFSSCLDSCLGGLDSWLLSGD